MMLTACLNAGAPEKLLITIRPPYVDQATGQTLGGKAPAVLDGMGEWAPSTWQSEDTSWDTKLEADQAGANTGLILGTPGAVNGHIEAYAAVDIDLNTGCEDHRNRLLNSLAMVWPADAMQIRDTVPWRGLLLVRMKNPLGTGRKTVYRLTYKGEQLGKIELMTTGQQVVIAGRHPSGRMIQWHNHGSEDMWDVPHITAPLPEFEDFNAMAENIREHLEQLSEKGYSYEATVGGDGMIVADNDLVPDWLTVHHLIHFIDEAPNTVGIDREEYVAFNHAIAACRHGLEVRHGALPEAHAQSLRMSAGRWGAKWADYPKNVADPLTAELGKVDNDWFQKQGDFRTSWSRLVQLAQEFGFTEARVQEAQLEFQSDSEPAPIRVTAENDLPITIARAGTSMKYIEGSLWSDTMVASHLCYAGSLGQILAYMPPTKEWLVWNGRINGWVADHAGDSIVQWHIQQQLIDYTAKFGSDLNEGKINSMLSVSKLLNVKHMMSINLAKDEDVIKPSAYHLQTQLGTYDLRTQRMIPTPDRKMMFNTLYAGSSPDFETTETPLFDMLLLGLADGNAAVADWLWHYLGYCLLGRPKADCFVVIWGSGRNGKSVLLKVLSHIFGTYSVPLDSKVLLESGKNMHPTSLNRLRNKRIALVSEMSHKEKWNEALLKQITGGDMISAREMNQKASEFRSEAGLLVVCNELPEFGRVTPAMLARFRVIGTTRTPAVPDPTLEDKIVLQESRAILAKLMAYAMKVYNPNGRPHEHIILPSVPAAMKAEAGSILMENDPFFGWLSDECEYGPPAANHEERLDELKSRFDAWAARKNKGAAGLVGDNMSDKAFRAALRRIGISTLDEKGNPLRWMVDKNWVLVARGVRLKVREVKTPTVFT